MGSGVAFQHFPSFVLCFQPLEWGQELHLNIFLATGIRDKRGNLETVIA